MTLSLVGPMGIVGPTGRNIQSSGTGGAVATMKANFTSNAARLTAAFQTMAPSRVPTTGKFWFGLVGDLGIQFDFATKKVSRVTLKPDGTVDTVGDSQDYTDENWAYGGYGLATNGPMLFAAWCSTDSECDRVRIGGNSMNGVTGGAGGTAVLATAYGVSPKPRGPRLLAFGTTVPSSTPYAWNVNAACQDACQPCAVNPSVKWPTPGQAKMTPISLTATNTGGGNGNPNFSSLSDIMGGSNILVAPKLVAGNGVDLVSLCRWATTRQVRLTPSPGVFLYDTSDGRYTTTQYTNARLFYGPSTSYGDSLYYGNSGFCTDYIGAIDNNKWHLIAELSIQEFDNLSRQLARGKDSVAIYQGMMPTNGSTVTFSKVAVYHTSYMAPGPSHISTACGTVGDTQFIDPGSWPATVDLNWIPTAPNCLGCTGSTTWISANDGAGGFYWQASTTTCSPGCSSIPPVVLPTALGQTTSTGCS